MLLQVETLTDLAARFRAFIPNLAAAAVLLGAGWLAGRLLRALALRLLRTWSNRVAGGVGRFFRSRDVETSVRRGASDPPFIRLVGSFVFWFVFLFFAAAATETLGLSVVSTWLSGLAGYLPQALAAVLIVLVGVLAGSLLRGVVSSAASRAGAPYASMLGRLVQVALVALTVVVAFDQLGLEITFLVVVVAIVTAGILGGAALAFGLGARTAVSNIMGAHYVLKRYRVGHRVRIGDVEGQIAEITTTSVLVRTPAGHVLVPAKEFSERISVLVSE